MLNVCPSLQVEHSIKLIIIFLHDPKAFTSSLSCTKTSLTGIDLRRAASTVRNRQDCDISLWNLCV